MASSGRAYDTFWRCTVIASAGLQSKRITPKPHSSTRCIVCYSSRTSRRLHQVNRNTSKALRMAPSAESAEAALPKLVAFDLDGTLWWPEMYMLDGQPFTKNATTGAVFSRGEEVQLIGQTRAILKELATDPKWENTQVAYVSRTEYPKWATACLKLFDVADGITMFDMAQQQEIYPGCKVTHFKRIHQASGIDYSDMLFFDNETWNCREVSPMGVVCVYCGEGMVGGVWEGGLAKFAAAKQGAKKASR